MKEDVEMQRIIFATGNAGKMREIRMILADLQMKGEAVEVLSMKEAGIDIDIVEDGKTFSENAAIKAKAVAAMAPDAIVMADDSGLEVDYLNKEPGIYSARYLGEDTPYSEKNANIIGRLEGVPVEQRSARFVCAIAAAMPGGEVLESLETIEGYIGYEERGEHGFGYDPIFMVPAYQKSTAELTEEEKNEISHRGKALRSMKLQLQKYYDEAAE
jgi:XTP/dITP diphosphohydrolase